MKNLLVSMRFDTQELEWLDKIMREKGRRTRSDAVYYLLWAYAQGYVKEPGQAAPEPRMGIPPISTVDRSEEHRRKKAG